MSDLSARAERMARAHELLTNIAEAESDIAPLKAEIDAHRNELSVLVAEVGEAIVIPGLAKAEITNPTSGYTYDKKLVDRLIQQLTDSGDFEIAQRLIGCQQRTSRAGSLRVTFEKRP